MNSNFVTFLQEHRIEPTDSLLKKLAELGATEVTDLLDLEPDDLDNFQPPIMKKLEFVRLGRAIELLQQTKNKDNDNIVVQSPNVANHKKMITSGSNGKISDDTLSTITLSTITYDSPPLPLTCQQSGCSGTLSSTLGKRMNKMLVKLNGPDFRWVVSCSKCATKWHSCHFLCGYMSKISSNGSSDISRHEIGRYNRWQKKIIRPCVNNPDVEALQAKYNEEDKVARSSNDRVVEIPRDIECTMENDIMSPVLQEQKQTNDENTTKDENNGEGLTTQSIASFDMDDNLLLSEGNCDIDLCNGNNGLAEENTTSKRVKLADGSFSQAERKTNCEEDDMCKWVRKLLMIGDV